MDRIRRQDLCNRVVDAILDNVSTARQLAAKLNATSFEIHSVLVSLRTQRLIEPIATTVPAPSEGPHGPWREYVWALTAHAQYHGERIDDSVGRGCAGCQRIFATWYP